MKNWTIVASFPLPLEANLAKGKLQSEGITSMLRDELTVQSNYTLSNAIGGVKLLVHEADYEFAKNILVAAGYMQLPALYQPSWITKTTATIPFIGKLQIEYRFIVIGCAIILPALLILYWSMRQSDSERLVGSNWCIESIVYRGKEVNLDDIQLSGFEMVPVDGFIPYCKFRIDFGVQRGVEQIGRFNLPDLSNGLWKMTRDSLTITSWKDNSKSTNAESEHRVYQFDLDPLISIMANRSYKIQFKDRSLTLHSKHLTIVCKEY